MEQYATVSESENIRTLLNYLRFDTSVILFDLDNTVMRPHGYLGSDQWFMRLFELTSQYTENKQACSALVLAIYYEVQHHIAMRAVESIVIKLIAMFHDIGYRVFAITARGGDIESTTWKQLNAIGIDFDEVIFCAGQSKGAVLEDRIQWMEQPWKKVVMIDDKAQNLREVDNVLSGHNIEFKGLRYSKMDQKFIKEDNCESVVRSLQAFKFFSPHLQREVDAMLNTKRQDKKTF